MFVVVAICFAVALLCSWFTWKRVRLWKIMAEIPSLAGPSLPVLGNALQFERDSYEFHKQITGWCNGFPGGIFILWLGPVPVVVVYKPEYVEVLLSSHKNIKKACVYDVLHPWLGTGTSVADVSERHPPTTEEEGSIPAWAFNEVRRLQLPVRCQSFPRDCLIDCRVQKVVDSSQANVGKGEINIAPYITLCVLDIICETSMGVHVNAQIDTHSKYVQAVLSMCELVQERQKSPWLWIDAVYNLTRSGKRHDNALNILHGFTNKVINDRINERKLLSETGGPNELPVVYGRKGRILAFLDLLLEEYDKGNISKEGVREEVDTFMFEGHDTTAASLTWTLHLIGRHPDVQAKLQKEVDNFYECVGELISSDDLKQLNYIECVLKEGLRLFPSVPLMAREITDDCKFGSYTIPKGCSVVVATGALHRYPEAWKNPDTFDPDRFLSENNQQRHPYAYVPFSAGPRNCIGQKFALMEEKVVLSSILHHFNINSTQTTEDIRLSGEIILRSLEGVWVKLELRQH